GTGVQPGEAAAQLLHRQRAARQIGTVEIGNLQLAARRHLKTARDIDAVGVIEINTGNGPLALGCFRLLHDVQGSALVVEFDHAEASWIRNPIRESGSAAFLFADALQPFDQTSTVKYVITQNQGAGAAGDEVGTYDEGVRDALGLSLHGIGQLDAPTAPVAQKI